MAYKDVTGDANLTDMATVAATDRLLIVDDGTTALQDLEISVLSAYLAALTETLTNKTLTTPTIASFVNATHNHSSAATGGELAIDGWNVDANTWTYASASTFTVSGDQTAIFVKGTRIKWTQTTVKYGTVVSSSYGAPNTTVTIIVNTDYTIANAAISANYYSYMDAPLGFPVWFAYTPTGANITLGNGTVAGRYKTSGRTTYLTIKYTLGSTSAVTGDVNFTLQKTLVAEGTGRAELADVGTATYDGHATSTSSVVYTRAKNSAGTYLATGTALSATVPHTWATTDYISLSLWYEW